MTSGRTVVLELTRLEAIHLADLVTQFAELLDGSSSAGGDPAIARLVPDAYADDAEASREFRDVTERDLLERRRQDAGQVLTSLHSAALVPDGTAPGDPAARTDIADPAMMEVVGLRLEPDALHAWLRCLAAVRLVLAVRLEILAEDDHDADDPRFGVYEWLGYRLDGLVHAATDDH